MSLDLLRVLDVRMNEIAHESHTRLLSHEQYLVQFGRYQELLRLQEQILNARAEEEDHG